MLKDMMRQLRENKKLTKKQVADGIGISERAYITYEYGERAVSTDTLCKLADFYGVSTDYLLGREPKNETIKQLSAEFAMSETEQKLLNNYLNLDDNEKAMFNDYVDKVAAKLIDGMNKPQEEIIRVAAMMPEKPLDARPNSLVITDEVRERIKNATPWVDPAIHKKNE